MAVSWAKGRKDIRVLWEEQPPRTLARECLMCELPVCLWISCGSFVLVFSLSET